MPQRVVLPRFLLALALLPLTALHQLAAGAQPRRIGVWLTNSPSPLYYERSRIDRAVEQLDVAGFNTLYPNVWSRGNTFHNSAYAPMEPALAKAHGQENAYGHGNANTNGHLDPICRMTSQAHRRGMQVIPWLEYGLMEPADAAVVQQNPEWVLQAADGSTSMAMHGKQMAWLNPAHPGVRQRFIGLVREIVERCNVDGIQLDDHFAWPVGLGYDPYTRQLYRNATGAEPPANASDRAWMTWRRHQLTDLLRELRQVLKTKGNRKAFVSLSPGPFRFAYNHWLQDWELWALGGLIDELVVQNYAYSVAGFAKDLQQPALLKAKGWSIPVEIGVLAGFGGRTSTMDDLSQRVQIAFSQGYGVIYFYWEGLWGKHAGQEGPELRRQAFQQIHQAISTNRPPSPPVLPALPW
ncbi:glycoside hydrolase family 10 protein [Cyanobium sp. HWJ4-Hawea]|uniref:glycoside hydrolase family 10 protein n=1 Tax=Cyanobium sp. HWJ4-Hawea TaxID=2823713 RepID=UPI00396587DA